MWFKLVSSSSVTYVGRLLTHCVPNTVESRSAVLRVSSLAEDGTLLLCRHQRICLLTPVRTDFCKYAYCRFLGLLVTEKYQLLVGCEGDARHSLSVTTTVNAIWRRWHHDIVGQLWHIVCAHERSANYSWQQDRLMLSSRNWQLQSWHSCAVPLQGRNTINVHIGPHSTVYRTRCRNFQSALVIGN